MQGDDALPGETYEDYRLRKRREMRVRPLSHPTHPPTHPPTYLPTSRKRPPAARASGRGLPPLLPPRRGG